MKIEVGKFYRTKSRKKVRIICIDRVWNSNTVVGLLEDDGLEHIGIWTKDGCVTEGEKIRGDLISEWEEPRPRMLAWIHHGEYDQITFFPEGLDPSGSGSRWRRMPHLDEPDVT